MNSEVNLINHTSGYLATEVFGQGLQRNRPKLCRNVYK